MRGFFVDVQLCVSVAEFFEGFYCCLFVILHV